VINNVIDAVVTLRRNANLKKNDEVAMPTAIKNVVNALADLRQSTPEEIESLVQANFSRLTVDDPWLLTFSSTLAPESRRKRG